jgi:predicted pyridoxine 5'-phosphate oxidase superfamily flavin-nucleotide-binding protein
VDRISGSVCMSGSVATSSVTTSSVGTIGSVGTASPVSTFGSVGERDLQRRTGTTHRAERFYAQQVLDHLNAPMREFVSAQQMMFLATSDSRGACDNSFRSGPSGFVRVLDEHRLVWPEYRGNGVMASLGNIIENPHVGLLFIDFFTNQVGLHVNGRATITADASIRARYPDLPPTSAPEHLSVYWVTTVVDEAYIHCNKRIPCLIEAPGNVTADLDPRRRSGSDFFVGRVPRD